MANNAHFHGTFEDSKYRHHIGLQVFLWEEDGFHFVYAPALDLSGYGESEDLAKESFNYTLGELITYTNRKKTMFDFLEKHGWTTNRKKKKVKAPSIDEMLQDNDSLQEVINRPGVKTTEHQFDLSLA